MMSRTRRWTYLAGAIVAGIALSVPMGGTAVARSTAPIPSQDVTLRAARAELKPGVHVSTHTLPHARVIDHEPKSVLAAARSLRSEADLPNTSAAVQEVVETPTKEKRTIKVAVADVVEPMSKGHGHVGGGCWNVWVSKERDNVFGWTLIKTETELVTVCPRGKSGFSPDPGVLHLASAHWGWFVCGWSNQYEYPAIFNGYHGKGAGGTAQFQVGYKFCPVPLIQLWTEIQAYGDGNYWWWTN